MTDWFRFVVGHVSSNLLMIGSKMWSRKMKRMNHNRVDLFEGWNHSRGSTSNSGWLYTLVFSLLIPYLDIWMNKFIFFGEKLTKIVVGGISLSKAAVIDYQSSKVAYSNFCIVYFRIFGIDPSATTDDGSRRGPKEVVHEDADLGEPSTEGTHDRIPFTGVAYFPFSLASRTSGWE